MSFFPLTMFSFLQVSFILWCSLNFCTHRVVLAFMMLILLKVYQLTAATTLATELCNFSSFIYYFWASQSPAYQACHTYTQGLKKYIINTTKEAAVSSATAPAISISAGQDFNCCNSLPRCNHPFNINHQCFSLHKNPTNVVSQTHHFHQTPISHNPNPFVHNLSSQDAPSKHKNLGAELPQSCHTLPFLFSNNPSFQLFYTSTPSTHKNLGAVAFLLTCLILFTGTRDRFKILRQLQGVVLAFYMLNLLKLYQSF